MVNWDLCSNHLKRVSRSFAFCIERLRSPLRDWVGLSYILCRLVDTIEDSPWVSKEKQAASFGLFEKFIREGGGAAEIKAWSADFPTEIPEGEQLLLQDASEFFRSLHAVPVGARDPMRRTVLDMCHGMAYFSGLNERGIKLKTLVEANQYCFFVAGIIGELLTELFAQSQEGFSMSDELLSNSYHFGLFLQKINLLKDHLTDLPEGRQLVPDRNEMCQSLIDDGLGAINYILSIPIERKDYRIFCAWSLFLGLASLPYIDQSWQEQRKIKIPRTKTIYTLGKVELNISSNEKLKSMYDQFAESLFDKLNAAASINLATTKPIWLYNYYNGRLNPQQMQKLRLLD